MTDEVSPETQKYIDTIVELTRHVRTPAGQQLYKLPIGSPIVDHPYEKKSSPGKVKETLSQGHAIRGGAPLAGSPPPAVGGATTPPPPAPAPKNSAPVTKKQESTTPPAQNVRPVPLKVGDKSWLIPKGSIQYSANKVDISHRIVRTPDGKYYYVTPQGHTPLPSVTDDVIKGWLAKGEVKDLGAVTGKSDAVASSTPPPKVPEPSPQEANTEAPKPEDSPNEHVVKQGDALKTPEQFKMLPAGTELTYKITGDTFTKGEDGVWTSALHNAPVPDKSFSSAIENGNLQVSKISWPAPVAPGSSEIDVPNNAPAAPKPTTPGQSEIKVPEHPVSPPVDTPTTPGQTELPEGDSADPRTNASLMSGQQVTSLDQLAGLTTGTQIINHVTGKVWTKNDDGTWSTPDSTKSASTASFVVGADKSFYIKTNPDQSEQELEQMIQALREDPSTSEFGGVPVSDKEIKSAIDVLEKSDGMMIKGPLQKANSPLQHSDYRSVSSAHKADNPDFKPTGKFAAKEAFIAALKKKLVTLSAESSEQASEPLSE